MKPRVDFVIVGAQKAGTTALFDYLGDVPGVALSTVKEVHFFDDERLDWEQPDYEVYHRSFPAPDGRICGEATPIYAYWPRALERMRAYNPDMRLIFMLRDPVDRAWSHWRMETDRGVETHPFAWCVREGRRRLLEAAPWGHHREFSYVERGFYGEQLERIFRLFGREQVLLLQNEDLRRAPDETLGKVAGFLGLPAPPPLRRREVHVGREFDGLRPEDVSYLQAIYRRDQERLRALMGLELKAPSPPPG